MKTVEVGVLAFQGAFMEHEECLSQAFLEARSAGCYGDCNVNIRQVRKADDIRGLHGLILPGGESTTMAKFLERNDFHQAVNQWRHGNGHGKPVLWGTCAGLILLANKLEDTKLGGQLTLGGVDITATRNVYGRQTESFESLLTLMKAELHHPVKGDKYEGIFIRAPGIKSVDSDKVEVLATLVCSNDEKRIVAVQQDRAILTSFHPELTNDFRWHRYFLSMVIDSLQ